MIDSIDRTDELSPLVWAYVGDAVFDLKIRERIISKTKSKPHVLHVKTSKIVNAKKQSEIYIMLDEYLEEEERKIGKRARNTKNSHTPKNTSPIEYAMSTALESIIGYLYLKNKFDRIDYLMDKIYKMLEI